MSKNEDGTTLYRGLAVDVMEWLKRRLNITYDCVAKIMKIIIFQCLYVSVIRSLS